MSVDFPCVAPGAAPLVLQDMNGLCHRVWTSNETAFNSLLRNSCRARRSYTLGSTNTGSCESWVAYSGEWFHCACDRVVQLRLCDASRLPGPPPWCDERSCLEAAWATAYGVRLFEHSTLGILDVGSALTRLGGLAASAAVTLQERAEANRPPPRLLDQSLDAIVPLSGRVVSAAVRAFVSMDSSPVEPGIPARGSFERYVRG